MTPTANTLDEIAARLESIASGPASIADMPVVFHKASGMSFRVSGMTREDYDAWHNQRDFEQIEQDEATKKGQKVNRNLSDQFLLEHAVYSEDGKLLTSKVASLLMSGRNFGASTRILIEAAAKENPPREELKTEFQVMLGFSRGLIVLYRILEKADLLGLLNDRISSDDEKRQAAIADLQTWLDGLPFWEALLDAEDAARELGCTIYEAATEKAVEASGGK